jgi:hypothetical protein
LTGKWPIDILRRKGEKPEGEYRASSPAANAIGWLGEDFRLDEASELKAILGAAARKNQGGAVLKPSRGRNRAASLQGRLSASDFRRPKLAFWLLSGFLGRQNWSLPLGSL